MRGGAERQKLIHHAGSDENANNTVLAWSYFSEKKFLSEKRKKDLAKEGAFLLEISSGAEVVELVDTQGSGS